MEDIAKTTVEAAIQERPLLAVLILCSIPLTWLIKRLLSDKDKVIDDKNETIKVLRENIRKKDEKQQQMYEFIAKVSTLLESIADNTNKNHNKSEIMLEKIKDAIDQCKIEFSSIQYK